MFSEDDGEAVAKMHSSERRTLLIADTSSRSRQDLVRQLQLHDDFTVCEASTGVETFERVEEQDLDLVLINSRFTDIDSSDVCKRLRRAGLTIPIVIVGDVDNDSAVILALNSGANDYIDDKSRIGVLVARLRAHLREHARRENAPVTFGPYRFYPNDHLLIDEASKQRIRLTVMESALLKFLCRNGSRVVRREEMLCQVWGYHSSVASHTVETHIYRLRQKIERDPAKPTLLLTEPGGYRLLPWSPTSGFQNDPEKDQAIQSSARKRQANTDSRSDQSTLASPGRNSSAYSSRAPDHLL